MALQLNYFASLHPRLNSCDFIILFEQLSCVHVSSSTARRGNASIKAKTVCNDIACYPTIDTRLQICRAIHMTDLAFGK
jgi:hypothetical protein